MPTVLDSLLYRAAPDRTTPPVITLVGPNPITVGQGTTYADPGATATDNVDGNITSSIVIDTSAVNTSVAGDYAVTYNVNDIAGNAATQVTRTVHVNAAPTADSQTVELNEDTSAAITLTASDSDNETLTFTVLTNPTHGTLSGTAPDLTYTPAPNYNGPDSFTFKVNDGHGDSNTATVSITVDSVNDAPVAYPQSVSTDEDTAKAITLTASDVDGDTLTYSVVAGPTHGSLSGVAPDLTYTPDSNYHGPDSFTFKATDNSAAESNVATISITVDPANDPPTADAQSVTTGEDTAIAVTLTGSDPDGDGLNFSVLTNPAHGSLSGTPPDLTYTPAPNYNGPDSFTFSVNDGSATSNTATVSITVNPVNDAPVADAQSVTTDEDTPTTVTLTGSDADNTDTLTYAIVDQPAHGTLSGTAPDLTYTPTTGYSGSDSFTFQINDGTTNSNTATVSITVNAVGHAPVADPQSVVTDEDVAKPITLTASDADGDTLTFEIVDNPMHGVLSGAPPDVTYTPGADYNGTDTFTFKASDATHESNIATVAITVNPVDDAPIADSQLAETDEDTAKNITLTASDIDSGALVFGVVTNPAHGVLSGTPPDLTYTPAANYNGPDSFTFEASDGTLNSNIATVSITIHAVNDPPTADAQNVTTNEDTAKPITLTGSDVEGNPLTYQVVANPGHGTLSGTAPDLTYTPAADYNGTDSFTFTTNDGTSDSIAATVSITVSPVNDAPTASSQSVTTDEDTPKNILLAASDVDGDELNFTVLTNPQHGTLSGTAPDLTYTPAPDYNGSDSFTFKADDGALDSNIATVSITVDAVNDAPVANSEAVTTDEDTAKEITLTGSDAENQTLTFTVLSNPAHGTLSGIAPDVTYTPEADYHDSDSFTFKTNDGTADSNVATISITVNSVNDAPTADAQSVITDEDAAKPITLTGADVDGDPLTFEIVDQPAHGSLSGAPPNVAYTPASNYHGSDSFTFKANDGTVDSSPATVSITINSVNHAPTADPQLVTTDEDTSKPITLTASDVDNHGLTFSIVDNPTHGTLSGTAPNVTYTPTANYNGSDSFTFKANDGVADSNVATVSITVSPVNDPPTADAQSVSTNQGTPLNITLTGTDVETAPTALSFMVTVPPAHGSLSGTAPNVTYTPTADYSGPDSFNFTVTDTGDGASPPLSSSEATCRSM